MDNANIWIEVACDNCGCVVGMTYKNAASITELKRITDQWVHDNEYKNLCPECQKELLGKKKYEIPNDSKLHD